MTPEWFAIWTRSRHEKMVRDQLALKDVEVFLPTITKWSRWKDRKKSIDWPLFPGYCFARFDSSDRLPVLKVEGVVTIVGTDEVDLDRNHISWVSPLARALMKAGPGDTVVLHAPGATEELEILEVRYERIPLEPFKAPPGAEAAPKSPRA